jgi:hypothetical protein
MRAPRCIAALLLFAIGVATGSPITGGPVAHDAPRVSRPISRDSVPELVRRLERDPLDRSAQVLRRRLFAWMTAADLGGCPIDAVYIAALERDLESADYPYREELSMQYMFGAACAALAPEGLKDCHDGVEAGLRSMIAAYRNMVQIDRSLRNGALDSLDQVRRLGRLGSYIQDREKERNP